MLHGVMSTMLSLILGGAPASPGGRLGEIQRILNEVRGPERHKLRSLDARGCEVEIENENDGRKYITGVDFARFDPGAIYVSEDRRPSGLEKDVVVLCAAEQPCTREDSPSFYISFRFAGSMSTKKLERLSQLLAEQTRACGGQADKVHGRQVALAVAARSCKAPALRRALKQGANPNHTSRFFLVSPLQAAAARCDTSILKTLLEYGAKIGAALHDVTSSETAKFLISEGGSVHAPLDNGRVPLQSAASYGDPDIIRALLKAGADVNARDKNGGTPLLAAAPNTDTQEPVRVLLAADADVNDVDGDGYTPLHVVNRVDVAETLLARGADVSITNNNGLTPRQYHISRVIESKSGDPEDYEFRENLMAIIKVIEAAESRSTGEGFVRSPRIKQNMASSRRLRAWRGKVGGGAAVLALGGAASAGLIAAGVLMRSNVPSEASMVDEPTDTDELEIKPGTGLIIVGVVSAIAAVVVGASLIGSAGRRPGSTEVRISPAIGRQHAGLFVHGAF